MITLYNVPVSSYGSKVIILLRHKGLEWTELPPPEGYGSPAYKKIIPAGTVPAIQHEGISLADSEAISEYLNELYPDPPMLPSALVARAQAREISRFHDTRLEPVLRSFFGQVAPDQRNPEFIAAQATLLQDRLDQLAVIAHPAPFMSGDTLGLADCGFPASFAILELLQTVIGLNITLPARLAAYSKSLNAHSSVSDEVTRYRAALIDWARSKGADI